MKNILFILLTLVGSSALAQTPISADDFNEAVYHRILLQKVNEYRLEQGKSELTNNLAISKAAKDQADYLKANNILSHDQPTPGKRTVEDRVLNYVTANRYTVGENLAQTYILINAYNYKRDGSTEATVANTYEQAADYMLNMWIQSPLHNANLLNENYELSGMSTYFEANTKKLTTVHVFAKLH